MKRFYKQFVCLCVCGLCLDFCEMCIDTMQFIDFSMTMLTRSICIVSVLILWLLSKRAMSIYHFPIPVSLIANIRICTHVLSIKCDTYNKNYTFNVNHEWMRLYNVQHEWKWMNELLLWHMIKPDGKNEIFSEHLWYMKKNNNSLDWIIYL